MADQRTLIQIEEAEGFNRTHIEAMLDKYFERTIGETLTVFRSAVPGVVAFERPDHTLEKVAWPELASELVRNTGLGVELVESADWQVDDEPDQDAIYISFSIPSLPSAYSAENASRNFISPILAGHAPSSADFAKSNEAMDYAKARAAELRARAEYATGSELEEAMRQAAFLEDGIATGTISACNMPVVEALLARDLEAAIKAAGPTEAVASFR